MVVLLHAGKMECDKCMASQEVEECMQCRSCSDVPTIWHAMAPRNR
jgi:hypothetical protein